MDINEILSKLTLSQKADLLTGRDFWHTAEYPELGVSQITFSDGPHGLRKQSDKSDHMGLHASQPATCFPTASALANSWNEQLVGQVGTALGEEASAQGVNVLLGPAVNIKRNPLCGRNFEYFSEDAYLSGKMAAAYIHGIQSNGTGACVKHFACNNQEELRMVSNSVLDERTLREIYLTAFEIAVKEGGAQAVMSSYNKINGTYADENAHLLNGILRSEWGFNGVVVSDWGGTNNKVASVKSGSDLSMPNCKFNTQLLTDAVKCGELDEELIDKSAARILRLGQLTSGEKVKPFDTQAHHELARKCAEQSIVLLKNDGILPLKSQKVAVIGDFAQKPRYQGAGSSVVNPTKLETVLSNLGGINCIGFEKGFERFGKQSAKLINRAVKLARKADIAVLFLGLDEITEAEGSDRQNIEIPENQRELFKYVRIFCKKVVVVLSCGSAVNTNFCRSANALVYAGLTGQAGAAAVVDVLTGKVNPSGKLAESFPAEYSHCPTYKYYHAKNKTAEYREGLFVGYNYYSTANVKCAYPFGHGLSYTTFGYSDISADENGVSFTVTNTGLYDGYETAQLYIGKKDARIFRPARQLKGFKKVFVKSGESVKVTINFDDKTFRYFNVKTNKWEVEAGEYQLYIGASSEDIRLQTTLEKSGTTTVMPYDKNILSEYYSGKVTDICDATFNCLTGGQACAQQNEFYKKNRKVIHENSTIADLKYAKGWLGRAFSAAINLTVACIRKFGKKSSANVTLMCMPQLPVRAIAIFGGLTKRRTEGLILAFNGKFFKGIHKFISK